ncbi:MAG TPA: HEAT repeat domain-containing protein [Planctomycetota bacterium]|nr:HEAT repeat domain-containing protein [Planctomycetota bacterium]
MNPRSALLLLLPLLAACSDAPKGPTQEQKEIPPPDMGMLRQQSKNLQAYVDALLLCGSTQARDWEDAKRQFELLQPLFIFKEDPQLIRDFRAGSETARMELARRGVILRSMLMFGNGVYDRTKWEEARKTLMEAGEPGQVLLVTTLLKMLLNGQNQELWPNIRFTLVDSGPLALETSMGLARELAQSAPENTPVFHMDDLVQVLMVVIGFGDAGRPLVEAMARSPKGNVRRATARAIGESRDGGAAPTLLVLLEDPVYAVRATAAEAAGALASAKNVLGPALVARIGKERDGKVLEKVLRSIGDQYYYQAVPDLIRVLEVPSREVAEAAMQALYIITGEKLLRREQWGEWYRTRYPDWLQKKQTPPK